MTDVSEALLGLAVNRAITHEELVSAGVDEATIEGERVADFRDINAARRALSLSDEDTRALLWACYRDDAAADPLRS
jgi:hypothetical protein